MSEKDFFERLKQNPRPVVVDFWAPWCSPCRMIEPAMKKLGETYADRVNIWKVNADEQPDVIRSLHIYGIPTLVAYNSGLEVARHTGAASIAELSRLFEAALSGEQPVQTGPAPLARLLRLLAGSVLFGLAIVNNFVGWYLLLAGIGAVITFSAVYDRCPIYKAVTWRLKALLGKSQSGQSKP